MWQAKGSPPCHIGEFLYVKTATRPKAKQRRRHSSVAHCSRENNTKKLLVRRGTLRGSSVVSVSFFEKNSFWRKAKGAVSSPDSISSIRPTKWLIFSFAFACHLPHYARWCSSTRLRCSLIYSHVPSVAVTRRRR